MAEPTPELQGADVPEGWFVPGEWQARGLETRLARKVGPGNPAHGHALLTALKSDHTDEVVFVERTDAGPLFWLVHLTRGTPVDAHRPIAVRIDFPADIVDV